ncbi:MAG TPA: Na+/H+ antiporter NhaA [Acidimicrobiales bacterium]|jgi:NhaA family Na+:H+ antiporter
MSEARPTWLGSDRPIARYVAQPLNRFLHIEAAGGLLLLAATAAALIWANSPWQHTYEDVWTTSAVVRIGSLSVHENLRHWVNDGLMAVFFFVVGLEIKRELVAGDLAEPRKALLPSIAALGGMIVPAAIYAAITFGGDGSHGWGIPMATDIAFTIGVLALLGDRVPASAKVLLLALAIVDDIGAILVIAVFYTSSLELRWLAAAVVGLGVVVALRRVEVWYMPIYIVAGIAIWFCTLESGIHATIAGVALGLLTPARPLLSSPQAELIADRLSGDIDVSAEDVREVSFALRESVSVAERIESALHPWSGYVIVPLFALANAGVVLSWNALSDAAQSTTTIGVIVGLVIGKPLGVVVAVAVAVRLGWTRLPDDLSWRHIIGLGALAGIGFTVSLFISGLAFDDRTLQDNAALGILAASLVAAAAGTLLLGSTAPSVRAQDAITTS